MQSLVAKVRFPLLIQSLSPSPKFSFVFHPTFTYPTVKLHIPPLGYRTLYNNTLLPNHNPIIKIEVTTSKDVPGFVSNALLMPFINEVRPFPSLPFLSLHSSIASLLTTNPILHPFPCFPHLFQFPKPNTRSAHERQSCVLRRYASTSRFLPQKI